MEKVDKWSKFKDWFKINYIYVIVISLIVMVMTFFMVQKEGYHEDEMFSFGSSNYVYDNVYRPYGKSDATNVFVKEKILNGNVIKNLKYYLIDNQQEMWDFIGDTEEAQYPIWRSKSEANDYLTMSGSEAINYVLPYYNQARDVHPPLFYFLVHTVMILFMNHFTKYIIFIINIVFMVLSLVVIKRIFEELGKENLRVPGMILYGFSMGAISTAILLRMYSMLTFFVLEYILINIRIIKNDFVIDKKTWRQLGIIVVFGFLTQYYFCIVAVLVAGLVLIGVCRRKEKQGIVDYIWNYMKMAIVGVVIYPFAVNHMFFSYRGVGQAEMTKSFLSKVWDYFTLIGYSYSVHIAVLAVVVLDCLIFMLVKRLAFRKEEVSRFTSNVNIILVVSLVLYTAIVVKISPELEYIHTLRYIMPVLPLMMILMLIAIDSCFSNHKKEAGIVCLIVSILVSCYGFWKSEPAYLYRGYDRYIEIADENSDKLFVYVGDVVFNHVQSMEEFRRYKESLILSERQLYFIYDDEKLNSEGEFILSIKKYKNDEWILSEIENNSKFRVDEMLLDDSGDVGCIIYRMKRVEDDI